MLYQTKLNKKGTKYETHYILPYLKKNKNKLDVKRNKRQIPETGLQKLVREATDAKSIEFTLGIYSRSILFFLSGRYELTRPLEQGRPSSNGMRATTASTS